MGNIIRLFKSDANFISLPNIEPSFLTHVYWGTTRNGFIKVGNETKRLLVILLVIPLILGIVMKVEASEITRSKNCQLDVLFWIYGEDDMVFY